MIKFTSSVPLEFSSMLQWYTSQGFRVLAAATKQLQVKVMVIMIKSNHDDGVIDDECDDGDDNKEDE